MNVFRELTIARREIQAARLAVEVQAPATRASIDALASRVQLLVIALAVLAAVGVVSLLREP